jgi:hypothetical protein
VELAAYVDLSEEAAAPGWMLDLIGEWLGEPRRGAWSDADYRYALRVRQRTRKSDGTWRDIYEVARLLRPDSATSDVTVGHFIAGGVGYATGWIGYVGVFSVLAVSMLAGAVGMRKLSSGISEVTCSDVKQ